MPVMYPNIETERIHCGLSQEELSEKSVSHGNVTIIGKLAVEFRHRRFRKWLICLTVPQIIFWDDLTCGNTQFAFSGCDAAKKG